jgi:hypothetical protein
LFVVSRVLSGRGLCDELITRPEESYRLCCVFVCDLETSRIGAPCIYDISNLRVNAKCKRIYNPLAIIFRHFCFVLHHRYTIMLLRTCERMNVTGVSKHVFDLCMNSFFEFLHRHRYQNKQTLGGFDRNKYKLRENANMACLIILFYCS